MFATLGVCREDIILSSENARVSSVCTEDVPPSQPVRVSGVCGEDVLPVRVSACQCFLCL